MKKRIITLLAILAVMVACLAFAVYADATTGDDTTGDDTTTTVKFMDQLCPCGSGNTLREETWTEWGLNENYSWTVSDHILLTGGSFGATQGLNGQAKTVILVRKGLDDADTGKVTVGPSGAKKWASNITKEVIFIGENAVLTGGIEATNGGLFRVNSGGKLTIKGGITLQPRSGYTTKAVSGGLIAVMPGGQCTLEGVTLKPASCTQGGAVFVNSGTLTMTDCTITGGATVSNGGAIALDIYSNNTVATLTNVTIENCTTAGNGGAIFFTSNVVSEKTKTVTLDGCTISGCTAAGSGGVAHLNKTSVLNVKDSTITANPDSTGDERGIMLIDTTSVCNLYGTTTITSANKTVGDGVYLYRGKLTLDGSASVVNPDGTRSRNIYRDSSAGTTGSNAIIQVDAAWTGSASVGVPGYDLGTHGQAFAANVFDFGDLNDTTHAYTAGTSTSAKKIGLYLENADHDNPQFAGYQDLLVTCRYALMKNGAVDSWHVTPATAFTNYGSASSTTYIKVWGNYTSSTTNLNREVTIDLNGVNVTKLNMGANGKAYVFDSKATAGNAGKTICVEAEPVTQFGGKTYISIYDEANAKSTVYPVEVAITSASLRLATAGIYYTAEVKAADAAKAVLTCGVAVKLDSDVTELAGTAYTAGAATADVNSIIVNSILTDAKADAGRANRVIYAKAYVAYDDEVIALSEAKNYSLTGLMELIAERFSVTEGDKALEDTDKQVIQQFYNKFADSVGWATNEAMKAIREFAPTEA